MKQMELDGGQKEMSERGRQIDCLNFILAEPRFFSVI